MTERVEKWDVFEARFAGPKGANPFGEVKFSAVFAKGNRSVPVDGFYDADGAYIVRFMPDAVGEWTFRTSSNAPALDGMDGAFRCVAPSAGNRGLVGVERHHRFRYADGSFYSCIGTTCYAWVHQRDALARQTLESLKGSPFNKLRMTVFPKSYVYNEHDDPEHFPFPLLKAGGDTWNGHWEGRGGRIEWEFDFTRFDVEFFRMLEQRVRQLMDLNIEADIILFHPYDRWGFAQMNRQTDLFYLRYVIARLGAFRNVWWSLANEWDFMGCKSIEDFDAIGRTIAECDPYHRLTGIHNGRKLFDHSRPWITHCSVQGHQSSVRRLREDYGKPVVIDEMLYEGTVPENWGNISAAELVHRFWEVALGGGYPGHSEVYLRPDHVMWWNKGGVLRGEGPARIAFLRGLMESGPDAGIDPHPERMGGLCCGCKGDGWTLCYTGIRQPVEALARLPEGRRYRLSHIDPWEMTITPTDTVVASASGPVRIPLTGRPHMAFLLEAMT